MTMSNSRAYIVVIGLGQTGKSCVRFLVNQGAAVIAMDSRENPPGLQELTAELPDVEFQCGPFDIGLLTQASEIVVSPGVSLKEPALKQAIDAGVPVIGDIALFKRHIKQPIVAITGSNAKSTVTTLVGNILQDAGINAIVAGNIGIPVMELLNQGIHADVYVLELSSFQLETTADLEAEVATILNVSEDHMDRYDNLEEYVTAKQRIFEGCKTAVINADDPYSAPVTTLKEQLFFTSSEPETDEFGLMQRNNDVWLAMGRSPIIKASELKIKGRHNQLNVLAAIVIGKAMNVPLESMVCTVTEFNGLAHRCQWIANIQGVEWFNDSKGTNVGATRAAITGIGGDIQGKIILIAGGDAKGADFSDLQQPARTFVKKLILIGRDANFIKSALEQSVDVMQAEDLSQAVALAKAEAKCGDAVLLSPACASFDMFSGFEDRGNQFMDLVHDMEACIS